MCRPSSGLKLALVLLAALLTACAQHPAPPEPAPEVGPGVAETAPRPAPARRPAAPKSLRVAVLLSDTAPSYQQVAVELETLLDGASMYHLSRSGDAPGAVVRKIGAEGADVIVAIGLPAAAAAKRHSALPVVFCQVFNYAEHDLLDDRVFGVSSIPPLELQLAAWKRLDPSLQAVAAILGEDHDALVAEARRATEQHGLRLHHRTANSDREALYLFNQLAPEIDGFWLFPDNRILSPMALREMLALATRNRVQVAVFNKSLLPLGATLSTTTRPGDVARTVVRLVESVARGRATPGDVAPLSELSVDVNEAVLEKYRLGNRVATTSADG